MGDFLSKVGHELTPGMTAAAPPVIHQIPGPNISLPDGSSLSTGTQSVGYVPQRPTFISSFLANLPSALAGGVQASMRPGGGLATGIAGGFQGVQQHDLLMNELGQRQFENQIAANRESREQQEFQANQNLQQQQLALAKQNAALNRFQIEKDQFGNISVFDKQKALDLAQQGQDPTAALTTHQLYSADDVNNLDQSILQQAGVNMGKLTPLQNAAHQAALAEAIRTHNPKPLEDFYNQASRAQQTQINLQIPRPAQTDARLDRSYQFNASALGKLQDPVDQTLQRMSRLEDTLAQGNPQSDALVAPELLSIMAGGQGSGLRMNEAEISRIVGGRSNWESLKAKANKWATDPNAARSITPAQEQQIRSLVGAVKTKLLAKLGILNQASQDLVNAEDVTTHRQILSRAKQQLLNIDGGGSATTDTPPAGAKVRDFTQLP